MLLLNLRNDDLLCRYAGDRFALLLPDTSVAEADALASHLAAMVGQMRHHAKSGQVRITLRHASSNADAAPDVLLAELSRAVSQPAAGTHAMAAPAASAASAALA
jgi:GGDEF domain-containing protein